MQPDHATGLSALRQEQQLLSPPPLFLLLLLLLSLSQIARTDKLLMTRCTPLCSRVPCSCESPRSSRARTLVRIDEDAPVRDACGDLRIRSRFDPSEEPSIGSRNYTGKKRME